MNFRERIKQTIAEHNIFQTGKLVLVAVSGGADSVALLLVLKELGYPLHALHCNFHLRGEESDRDEQFVRALCQEQGIALSVKHFETTEYAQANGIGIEMAARDLRYAWFAEQIASLGAQGIAVAHHLDDQAETVLLNIVRGTGLRGLAGMKYVSERGSLTTKNSITNNPYPVLRPLLDVSRADILDYLSHQSQPFVTDSTNLERETLRNCLRLDILPALSRLNPKISLMLSRLASNVQDALPIYDRALASQFTQKAPAIQEKPSEGQRPVLGDTIAESSFRLLPASPFQSSPFTTAEASLTLLHEWTAGCRFTRTQLENILQAETGKMVESATHCLLRDRRHFLLRDKSAPFSPHSIQKLFRLSPKKATVAVASADAPKATVAVASADGPQ